MAPPLQRTNHPGLARDPASRAVLSTDADAVATFQKTRQQARRLRDMAERLEWVERELAALKERLGA